MTGKVQEGMQHGRNEPLTLRQESPSGVHDSGVASTVDAESLERLLSLSTELPIDVSLRELAEKTVAAVAELLPDHPLGACLVDPSSGEQFVETHDPGQASPSHGRDPTRLFPGYAYERVIMLEDDRGGSTFHLAGEDASVLDPLSPAGCVIQRAVRVLSSAVHRARVYKHVQDTSGELSRLQAQVIQAEKLASLGQIVAGVVHELNNPLTSIVAYSDYLTKRAEARRDDSDDLERLRRISEAAERILKFSRDLVAYARPSSEIPGPVLLCEVVEKALVFCEHEFSESRVIIDSNVERALPPVRGIAGQLIQVFVNLFINAAHAMANDGGVLKVAAGVRAGEMHVEITDQGTGIEESVLDQIFEPFFTTKTDGRGTGLGLSIVRDIVNSHGGTLSARSAPERGTTFTVLLPLAACPPSMLPPRQ